MSADQIVALLYEAIERGDVDGALVLMADDCEYDNVPIGKAVGHDAIRQTLHWFVAPEEGTADGAGIAVRMVRFEIGRQVVEGSLLFNERIDHLLVGGKPVQMPVLGVYEIDPDVGKLVLWRDYFDLAQISGQITPANTATTTASLRPRLGP